MNASQRFRIKHNVTLRVLDGVTGKLVREHTGHNTATNTLIEGVGHYLAGEGVLRQGYSMLARFVPRYISLGTMGLVNQNEDANGLPTGISGKTTSSDEATKFQTYVDQRPGYGTDGYSASYNNGRPYYGLGVAYTTFSVEQSYHTNDIVYYNGQAYKATKNMIARPEEGIYNYWDAATGWTRVPASDPSAYELISPDFPRQEISFRDVVPEYDSSKEKTVEVVFSAMISAGALDTFRDTGKNYIFITEAGLWSEKEYQKNGVGVNGLVAGYRMLPPSESNWYMTPANVPDNYAESYCDDHGWSHTTANMNAARTAIAAENRQLLKQEVLRVEKDQVVQVIWKIEIGNVEDTKEVVMSVVPGDIAARVDNLERLIAMADKAVFARNVSIPTSRWTTGGIPNYSYAAKITMNGIDGTFISTVECQNTDMQSFYFAPTSATGANSVTVYCKTKPDRTIVLPLVVCSQMKQISAT